MRTAFLLSVSLAIRLFAAGPVAGVLPSPLLVSGSGRCYLLRPDGTVAWEKKGCGNIHRAYVRGPHVYWSNGDIFRTEIATGATSLFYSPAPKEGAFGFDIRPSGNVVVAENATGFIVDLAAGTTNRIVRFAADAAKADGSLPAPHHRFRMVRATPQGTYLVCCSGAAAVREYDAAGRLLWEQPAPPLAFDAIRRANGNTLVSHLDAVTEYTPGHAVAWRFSCADAPELKLANLCGIQEMPDGNLVVGTYANGRPDGSRATAFEVTREKRIVWSFASPCDRNMMTVFRIDAAEWPAEL